MAERIAKQKKIQAIIENLKKGHTMENACKLAGVDYVTFWRWRKKSPQLARKIEEVYESRIQIVEDVLWKKAMRGNITAIIFLLTNRAPDRWRDRRAVVNNQIINRVNAGSDNGKVDKEFQEQMLRRLGRLLQE